MNNNENFKKVQDKMLEDANVSKNENTTIREKSSNWWNNLSFVERAYKLSAVKDKYFSFFEGRKIETLTGREIEMIYSHFNNFIDVKDIKHYNKLCAEFLGYVNTTPTDKVLNIYEYPNGEGLLVSGKHRKMLETNFGIEFTADWNWIMKVIDKIETKTFDCKYTLQWEYDNREEFKGYKAYWFALMPKDEILSHLKDVRYPTRIEAVINAIHHFLIYHNERNK